MPLIHSKRPAAFKKNIESEHKAHGGEMCAHGGPAHCNMGCYSKGGVSTEAISNNRRYQKGVHESITHGDAGTSVAGAYIGGHGYGNNPNVAKKMHKEKLDELRSMKGPHGNYAHGGEVGWHDDKELDDLEHDPEMLAKGGELDDDEMEMSTALAEELMTAIERKDHKQMMEAIEAIVLNCLNKGEK